MSKPAKKKTKEPSGGRVQTHTVRFNKAALARVKEAAELRGWSVSKLIQDAAIEKAAGILNQEHGSSGIGHTLGLLARLMVGAPPRFSLDGEEFNMPKLLDEVARDGWEGSSWQNYDGELGDGNVWNLDIGFGHRLLVYSADTKEVWIEEQVERGFEDKVRIHPHQLAPTVAQQVFKAMEHCGASDLAGLLKRIYEQELYGSTRQQRDCEMIDPKDLIDSS